MKKVRRLEGEVVSAKRQSDPGISYEDIAAEKGRILYELNQQRETLKTVQSLNGHQADKYAINKKYEDELHAELRSVENTIVECRR
jgi:hypothetical protein